MAKLTDEKRQAQIVTMLAQNGAMKSTDLSRHFGVSRETIRRDLITLNEAGEIKKYFGSAIPAHDFSIEPVSKRSMENHELKERIARKALSLMPSPAIVFIDTGSTPLCFAQLLKPLSGYTVITNSMPVVNELIESDNQVIIAGGTLNHRIWATCGLQTASFLQTVKVEFAILGSSGFERHHGPASNNFDDANIKQAVIDGAMTSLVLADSTKASYSSLLQYASWRDISYLITDAGISDTKQEEIAAMTDVVIVDVDE